MKNKTQKIITFLFLIFSLFLLVGCKKTYSLTLGEGITVNVENPSKIEKGALVTVTVTLPEGKEIDELLINGIPVEIEGNSYTFTFNGKTNVSVTFKEKEIFYSLELGNGITANVSNLSKILKNTEVTLNFSIDEEKEIDKLLINGQEIALTGESYSFFINENTTAELVLKDKELYYSLSLGEGLTANLSDLENILKDTEVTLTFNVPTDKAIDKLLVNGKEVVLTAASYTFNITENTTAELILKDKEVFYSLTLGEGLTANISDLENILKDTLVTLTFTIPNDKVIEKLLVNGKEVVLTTDSYTFNITENTTAELVLKDKELYYSLSLGEGLTANLSDLNNILKDTPVTLTFNVPTDKVIEKLLVNGKEVVLTTDSYTFNINEDTIAELILKDKEVFYSLTLGENLSANFSDLNNILKDTLVTLTFNVPTDKVIDKLLVNGKEVVLTTDSYTFNITENTTAELILKDKEIYYSLTLGENLSANFSDLNNILKDTLVTLTFNVPTDKVIDKLLVNGKEVVLTTDSYTFNITENTTAELILKDKEIYYSLTLGENLSANLSDLENILKDTEVTLTLNVPSGKVIDKLLVNGKEVVLTTDSYTFNITENTTAELILKDKEIYYSLTLGENLSANLSDLENILKDTEVTLTLNVPSGKVIDKLLVNGKEVVLTTDSYTFNITENTTAELILKDKEVFYSLTLGENISANVSDLENILKDTEVIIDVITPIGKLLKHIVVNGENIIVEDNKYTFNINEDTVISAVFDDVYLSLTLPEFVTANLTNIEEIKYNSVVTLTVIVSEGYVVDEFLVNNELKELTNLTYTFNITNDTVVSLTLKKLTYKLTLGDNLSADITNLDNIDYGTAIKITIDVPIDKELKYLVVNGKEVNIINNIYEFIIYEDTTINAIFNTFYSLVLPEFVRSNISDLDTVYEGTKVILTINVPDNKTVSLFKVNDENVNLINNTYEFNINANTIVIVEFISVYKLTLPENVTANVDDLNNIVEDMLVILTVNLALNEELNYLKVNDIIVSLTDNKYEFNILEDIVVTINFTTYYNITLQEGLRANVSDLEKVKKGTEVILTLDLSSDKHLKALYINEEIVNNFSNYYKFNIVEDINVTFTYYDEALLAEVINFILNVDKTFITEGTFKISKHDYSFDYKENFEFILDLDEHLNIIKGKVTQQEIYGLKNNIYNMYFSDILMYYESFEYENGALKHTYTDFDLNFYQSDLLEMILGIELFDGYNFIPTGPYSINDFIYQLILEYSVILKDNLENNLIDNIKFYQEDNDMIIVYKANIKEIFSLASMFTSLTLEDLENTDENEFLLEIEFLFTNNKFVNLKVSFTENISLLEDYNQFYIGYYNDEVILPEEFYEFDVNELDTEVYYFHYDEDKVVEIVFPQDGFIDFSYLTPYKKGFTIEGYYTDKEFLHPLTEEDLVNGIHIYIKWQVVKTVEELLDNFIFDGLFVLYNDESYSLYMESDKYIYYQNENEELFVYDKLNDKYYRVGLVNDEFIAIIVPENSFTLLSIISYLTDENNFNIEVKGAYFDLDLLMIIEENSMFISIDAPFNIASGIYVSEDVVSLEEFNMILEEAINNAIEDEIYGLDFYYEHHFYDINNVEDDVLFYILYVSGRKELTSLKLLKETYNILDYILPSIDNDYKLTIIIGENEMVMDNFIFYDGSRGKILVYDNVYYYLDELEELPIVTVGEFETLINYKVNKFYFNTLEELKNYQTTDKVLILEKGKVDYISYNSLLDIFRSYEYVVINNYEFTIYYNFNLNTFYAIKDNGLKLYFEFNEDKIIFISENIKVVVPNTDFHKDSFIETFFDSWEFRAVYYHIYTIYNELNNVEPRKHDNFYSFNNMHLYFEDDNLIVNTTDNYWLESFISFTDEIISVDITEEYIYEAVINNNIIEPIYYYANYPHLRYYYNLNNYYLIGVYNYDEFGEVDFDSHFYGDEFYEKNKLEVYALYGKIEDISYYIDYYKSFEKYILESRYDDIKIKVDINNGIEFYQDDNIFGYIDLSTGNKYRILDNKLYLTEDSLLFNFVQFFNTVELDEFYLTGGFRYNYYANDFDVYIYVTNYDLEIYLYEGHQSYLFEFIEEEFTNFDFSNYETAIEEPVSFELLEGGISGIDNYEYNTRFKVLYNNGLTKILYLYELKKEFPVEVIIEKYQTTIIITLNEIDYIYILDDENNFVYNEEYGLIFIFEGFLLIYEDDLINLGSLPEVSLTDDIYEFSNWMLNGEFINDLEELLFKAEEHYRHIYLQPQFKLKSYSNLIEVFNSYEYLVLSNYEYIAYYNFKENYFYIDSNEGLMYISFIDEEIVFTTEREKYIIPKEKFNYESFLNQNHYWYNYSMFTDIYAIYYELNNIVPNTEQYSYEFLKVVISLYGDELYLLVRDGFWQDSRLTFTNEELNFEINYTYEKELIIDNNITTSIYYYANDWDYFEYLFLNSYLEDYYNYCI